MKKRNLKTSIALLTVGLIMVSCMKEEVEIAEQTQVEKTEYLAPVSAFDEMANSKTHLAFLDKTYDFVLKVGTEIELEMPESTEENFTADLEDNYEKTGFKSAEDIREAHEDLLDSYLDFRKANASYFKVVEESEETIEIHYDEMATFAGEYFSNLAEGSVPEFGHVSFIGCVLEAAVEFIENVAIATSYPDLDDEHEIGIANAASLFAQQILICVTGY